MFDVTKLARLCGSCLFVAICTFGVFYFNFPLVVTYGFGLYIGFFAADIWFN
jgi:hypothetical protein